MDAGVQFLENIFTLSIAIILTTIGYYVVQSWRLFTYWKKRGVAHPTPVPFFGNTFPITSGNQALYDFHLQHYRAYSHEKISGFYEFGRPMLVVHDPDLINQILTKDFAYFHDRGFPYDEVEEPLTANLFNMGGQRWKNVRTKTSSCFTTQKRKAMFLMMENMMDGLKNLIHTEIDTRKNEELEIKDILARFSTDVITECAFGIRANSMKNPNAEFRVLGRQLLQPNSRIRPILLQICPKIMQYFGVRFLSKEMNNFFVKFVKDAIEFRKHNKVERNDFLNSMIELMEQQASESNGNNQDITYATIAAECWFFFFAGFEASALVISMTLFELARNQDIQEKLRTEVDTVLQKYGGQITYDALQEMIYMEMVAYEIIRLYPSLPTLFRNCHQKYKIPNTDIVIDKGVGVVIPVAGLHLDSRYYENPEKFNPENFSEDAKKSRHRFAYLPFGEGPRICIASRFGMMQIKAGLATVMRNFQIFPSPKTETPLKLTPRLILTNSTEVWVKIQKRNI